jgi:hypothetical protein
MDVEIFALLRELEPIDHVIAEFGPFLSRLP